MSLIFFHTDFKQIYSCWNQSSEEKNLPAVFFVPLKICPGDSRGFTLQSSFLSNRSTRTPCFRNEGGIYKSKKKRFSLWQNIIKYVNWCYSQNTRSGWLHYFKLDKPHIFSVCANCIISDTKIIKSRFVIMPVLFLLFFFLYYCFFSHELFGEVHVRQNRKTKRKGKEIGQSVLIITSITFPPWL